MKPEAKATYYTSGEIGRICNIPARTARRYLQSGKIQAEQNPITGRWKVDREALVSFLGQHGLESQAPATPQTKRQILVIDDEEWITSFIRDVLVETGLPLAVETFTDSHLACIRLGSITPDLVILDLRMPHVDGRQVLAAIRQEERTRGVPVLIISGYPDDFPGITENAKNVVCLTKPFTDQQLLDVVLPKLNLTLPATTAPAATSPATV